MPFVGFPTKDPESDSTRPNPADQYANTTDNVYIGFHIVLVDLLTMQYLV